jgi:exopolyphosphatase/guanosine-5'-triphosphate,3'-diphosphate pyrophosphatase
MLYAVIDIGSNAARLLLANAWEVNHESYVEKASLVRVPIRLGSDVFTKGKIGRKKRKDLINTLRAFKLLINLYKPTELRVLATAAMREASNSNKILKKVKEKTGLEIDIISGKEEADIIRTTNTIPLDNEKRPILFVDVGGGSTEVSLIINQKLIDLKSFHVGTLRLLNGKFDPNIWKEIENWLGKQQSMDLTPLIVGSGGNINKINKLFGDVKSKMLSKEQLLHAYEEMKDLSLDERMSRYGFRPDRADVIVPAAEIYLQITRMLNAQQIFVPKIGLADGMVHLTPSQTYARELVFFLKVGLYYFFQIIHNCRGKTRYFMYYSSAFIDNNKSGVRANVQGNSGFACTHKCIVGHPMPVVVSFNSRHFIHWIHA